MAALWLLLSLVESKHLNPFKLSSQALHKKKRSLIQLLLHFFMRQEYFDNTPAPTFNATPVHTECQKCTTGTILYNYNRFSSAFLGFLHSIKGALTYGIRSSFSE